MSKKFIILVIFGIALAVLALTLQWGNFGTTVLWRLSNEGSWLFAAHWHSRGFGQY
ncbi:MAG: hypothetical protein Q7K16_03565 [Candidatus Azambacteria bacterium]|nr:hypothetical protein [Candidatus Azambacteria bacterium]